MSQDRGNSRIPGFSHDKALNREHDQFLSVTVAVDLGGGLFFLVALPLILRFECPFESLTKLGWVEFFLWLVALLYSAHCAKSGKGVFRLLDQWEQSLLRRKKDLEALAAYREGQILYKLGAHGILRPVEERNRVLVTKIPNGKERMASRPDSSARDEAGFSRQQNA
jgi:hypothetical protein